MRRRRSGAYDLLVACDAKLDPADGGLWDSQAISCRIVVLHFNGVLSVQEAADRTRCELWNSGEAANTMMQMQATRHATMQGVPKVSGIERRWRKKQMMQLAC
jgi:hypothetical protein